jgi:uncharacterized membrane protein
MGVIQAQPQLLGHGRAVAFIVYPSWRAHAGLTVRIAKSASRVTIMVGLSWNSAR